VSRLFRARMGHTSAEVYSVSIVPRSYASHERGDVAKYFLLISDARSNNMRKYILSSDLNNYGETSAIYRERGSTTTTATTTTLGYGI
jgi:hypothetical protein